MAKVLNLKCNDSGIFRILQLTDLHFGTSKSNNHRNVELIQKLVKLSHVDFISITGDLVFDVAGDKEQTIREWISFLGWTESFNIPYDTGPRD